METLCCQDAISNHFPEREFPFTVYGNFPEDSCDLGQAGILCCLAGSLYSVMVSALKLLLGVAGECWCLPAPYMSDFSKAVWAVVEG